MERSHNLITKTAKKKATLPLGGWLIVLNVNLIIILIWKLWRLSTLYNLIFNEDPNSILDLPMERSILLSSEPYFIANLFLSIFIVAAIIQLLLLLFLKDKTFIPLFKQSTIFIIIVALLKFAQLYIVVDKFIAHHYVLTLIGFLQIAILLSWIPYLSQAKRVRVTFN